MRVELVYNFNWIGMMEWVEGARAKLWRWNGPLEVSNAGVQGPGPETSLNTVPGTLPESSRNAAGQWHPGTSSIPE